MVAAGIIAERDTTAALIYRSLDERCRFYDALLETVQVFGGLLLRTQRSHSSNVFVTSALLSRQARIEDKLAGRHLQQGTVVLYDVTSTSFEGCRCPLARYGHSRDERPGNPQIVFGLLTNREGCPVAVEVCEGNTADPKTVAAQIRKLRQRFHLNEVVMVGGRSMLTSARIREDLETEDGLRWITALKAPQIHQLAASGNLQLSLFDQQDLAEIQHPAYPGERLIACHNPLLAEERRRKREELVTATEKQLQKIHAATQRQRRPLRGKREIGLAVGKVLGHYKMGKHFELTIEEDRFDGKRKPASIEREAALGWHLCDSHQAVHQFAGGSDI